MGTLQGGHGVVLYRKKILVQQAEVGDELVVLSTDEGSANDIPEWINKVGHEVIESSEEDGVWSIVVKKAK